VGIGHKSSLGKNPFLKDTVEIGKIRPFRIFAKGGFTHVKSRNKGFSPFSRYVRYFVYSGETISGKAR